MWNGSVCLGTFYKNAESNVRNAGLFALLSKSTSDPERTGPFHPSLLLLLSEYARDIYLPCPCCAISGSSGIERVKENKKQENASHIKLLFAPPFAESKKSAVPQTNEQRRDSNKPSVYHVRLFLLQPPQSLSSPLTFSLLLGPQTPLPATASGARTSPLPSPTLAPATPAFPKL